MSEASYRRWFGQNLTSLTQETLAESIGITAQHLSYLETGKRSPSFEVIARAAETFNVSPADLLADTPKTGSTSKHREVVAKIEQMTKSLSKADQDRLLRIISNCVNMNRSSGASRE